MTDHLKELDELVILTIDVEVIGSSFLWEFFWESSKNRYFLKNRALEF